MEQVTADYALRGDGTVEVVNRGYVTADREWREARGKARFVGSPEVGAHLWILSRTPEPPRAVIERLAAHAESLGFDTGSLIYVRH